MTDSDQRGEPANVFDDHLAAEFVTKNVDACVVAGLLEGKLAHEHTYWDQASLLVQVGLLDPAGLPVTGAVQADKLLAPRTVPANALLGPEWVSTS